MNNKGVTLIELLIVIVVIGIISAFAVPAVGNFLDSAKKQAVYQDAVAVRNAAAWYCGQASNTCVTDLSDTLDDDDGTILDYSDLSENLDGFDSSLYVTTGIAELQDTNTWIITLEQNTTGDYEWVTTTDPVNGDTSDVTID